MNPQDPVIANVERLDPTNAIQGVLDRPSAETPIFDGKLFLAGWAIGTTGSVTGIEVLQGDRIVGRIGMGWERPDVAAVFPNVPQADKSGFRGGVQVTDIHKAQITVRATLKDGESAALARMTFRPAPRPDSKPPTLMIKRPAQKGDDPSQWAVPPFGLMEYGESPGVHLELGRKIYETMRENCVSAGFDFDQVERILEFGCANGRVTRWFSRPADREIWGCDIQSEKVFWALENLSPPLRFVVNDPTAHLPFQDESVDFLCALSVFTHLKENHISWLLELLRIMARDGALYMTVHDETAFAQPDAHQSRTTYFAGLQDDLDDVAYAAINDYREGTLSQVYVSQEYISQTLPRGYRIERTFSHAMGHQSAYLITRQAVADPVSEMASE